MAMNICSSMNAAIILYIWLIIAVCLYTLLAYDRVLKVLEFFYNQEWEPLCYCNDWAMLSDLNSDEIINQLLALSSKSHAHTHTHNRLTSLFRDYPGEPVPER